MTTQRLPMRLLAVLLLLAATCTAFACATDEDAPRAPTRTPTWVAAQPTGRIVLYAEPGLRLDFGAARSSFPATDSDFERRGIGVVHAEEALFRAIDDETRAVLVTPVTLRMLDEDWLREQMNEGRVIGQVGIDGDDFGAVLGEYLLPPTPSANARYCERPDVKPCLVLYYRTEDGGGGTAMKMESIDHLVQQVERLIRNTESR